MRPFTATLMLLAQRLDEALRAERGRSRPDTYLLTLLRLRRRRLAARLNRSLGAAMLVGR
jgi:hypothetical protein